MFDGLPDDYGIFIAKKGEPIVYISLNLDGKDFTGNVLFSGKYFEREKNFDFQVGCSSESNLDGLLVNLAKRISAELNPEKDSEANRRIIRGEYSVGGKYARE